MKKTSLLSLLTAGAIVATSAGTYAAWDTLTASANKDILISDQVNLGNVMLEDFKTTSDTLSANELVYESTFTVISTDNTKLSEFIITPTVSGEGIVESTDYDIVIKEGGTPLADGKDTTLELNNTYTVELKAKTSNIAGKKVNVKVDVIGTKK